MGRYRKILVAFDGSDSSRNALLQGIKFARSEQCWIKVVSVMPSYQGDIELTGVKNIKEALRGPSEKLLGEALQIASSERASILTGLEEGEAHERIVHVAETENCDLIIMGKRGRNRFERSLLGSVTARVIGHSHKDIMVVPKGAALEWHNILLCIDGSRYSHAAAKHAISFSKSYGSDLAAISTVDITDEFFAEAPELHDKLVEKHKGILEELRKEGEASGIKIKTFIREGDPSSKILELARTRNTGMIFMGSHGRTGIRRLLMGSVTEKVVGYSSCPVMVVRP